MLFYIFFNKIYYLNKIKKMLKVSPRRNLIYVFLLILCYNLRKITLMLVGSIFGFTNSIIFSTLMFLGEFLTGLIIKQYQKKFITKNKFLNPVLTLVKKKMEKDKLDSNLKIYSIYFLLAYADFIEFTISVLYVPKFQGISGSLETRLCGLVIIFTSIMYYYILKYPLLRHQIFSLIVIGICLVIIIMSETFFQRDNIYMSTSNYLFYVFLISLELFFLSVLDSGDKYLMEFNSIEPCQILLYEGFIGTIFSFIGFIEDKPISKIKNIYDKFSAGYFALFIFLLFLYLVLSGFKNIYRLHTNKSYSPMAQTLANYALNPLFMIYDAISRKDFIIKGEVNYFYFFINLVLSIIISFTGFVLNEFIVLFCCGLEYNTYRQISERAKTLDSKVCELASELDDEISNNNKKRFNNELFNSTLTEL